jgi:hypothetical protein
LKLTSPLNSIALSNLTVAWVAPPPRMADTDEGLIVMLLIRAATAESSLTGPAFGAAFAGAFCAGEGPCRTRVSLSPDAHRGHEPPHAHRCIAGVGDSAADGGAAG